VSGRVILNLEKDEDIKSVSIRFEGKINTEVLYVHQSEKKYKHEIVMFLFEETLFKGPFKLRATTYESNSAPRSGIPRSP
jgi:hypothetical protein